MNNYYIVQEYGDSIDIIEKDPKKLHNMYSEIVNVSNVWKKKLGLPYNPFDLTLKNTTISLRAKGITGFISICGINIEIVPKFLRYNSCVDDNRWKIAITRILMLINQSNNFDNRMVSASKSSYSISDLLGERFYISVKNGIERGLPRTYIEIEDSIEYFKGRFNYKKYTETLIRKDVIPCIYEEYSLDCNINRLLRWAASELAYRVSNNQLSKNLTDIYNYMHEVSILKNYNFDVKNIKLPTSYNYLQEALDIAMILLESKGIEPNQGNFKVRGFLWKSADVYEKFIKLIIHRVCKQVNGWKFTDKAIELASPIDNNLYIKTYPDIRIKNGNDTICVLDAKYKVWSLKPKNEDIYQVICGARVSNCKVGGLIYPSTDINNQVKSWNIKEDGNPEKLTVLFVDINEVAEDSGLDKIVTNLKNEIFSIIN